MSLTRFHRGPNQISGAWQIRRLSRLKFYALTIATKTCDSIKVCTKQQLLLLSLTDVSEITEVLQQLVPYLIHVVK